MITRTSTRQMSREEWLEARKGSIGGSDAAAIVGLSKWSTPYAVWAEKTGRLPEKEDSEAMRQGRDLEDYVARRFEEQTGKKVRKVNAILKNSKYPFAHANVDRAVTGEDAVLEIKTTRNDRENTEGDRAFSPNYYAQCMHYLAVTGAKKCYLAVLVWGRGFYVYEIERDEAEIKALMDAEAAFWAHVESDTPPATDGFDPTTEALTAVFPESRGGSVNLFGDDELLDRLDGLKETRKRIDESIADIENAVKAEMGDAETGVCGKYTVTWKNASRTTFDSKRFIADHASLDLTAYIKTTAYRTFKIKKDGE